MKRFSIAMTILLLLLPLSAAGQLKIKSIDISAVIRDNGDVAVTEKRTMLITNSLTEGFIEAFKDKWNWTELSGNTSLELIHELLEKFVDYWAWEEIIDRFCDKIFEDMGIDFYERYKDYIPAAKLQNSRLWNEIVSQQVRQLTTEIIA